MSLKEKLFGFEGRLRRRDWWALGILIGLINFTISEMTVITVFGAEAGVFGGDAAGLNRPEAMLTRLALWLPFLWPTLALSIKRRHDRGKSGTGYVAVLVLSMLTNYGPFAAALAGYPGPSWLPTVLPLLVAPFSIWMLILTGFLDGEPRPNRYGPSPKQPDMAETFS